MTELQKFLDNGGLDKLTHYALVLTDDNREEAEDLVSTVLLEVHERPPKKLDKEYEKWIMSAVRYRYNNHCRNRIARTNLEESFSKWRGEETYQPDLEPDKEDPIYGLSLKQIMLEFKPMDRAILGWFYIQNRSGEETEVLVARCYGRTFKTGFRMYIKRLRDRLERVIKQLSDSTFDQQTPDKTLPEKSLAA